MRVIATFYVKAPLVPPYSAPSITAKAQTTYAAIMSPSNTLKVSFNHSHATTTAIGGPRFANRLMVNSEMYLVLVVLMMFDHELCNDLNARAELCWPITSS